MSFRHVPQSALSLLAVVLAAAVGASAGAQEDYVPAGRGVPVIGAPAGGDCESCRSGQRPPWHGSAMAGRGYPVGSAHGGPCMSGVCGPRSLCRECGPASSGPCGSCGPCGKLPGVCGLTGGCHPPVGPCWWGAGCQYPLPPCLPRLHAYLREGMVLSPQPLVIPKCHKCGAHIPGGF
jgi:hypothetical protein